ncbi:MAG TPA: glycosyltransferase [Candidatus Angelobacter sp.]|nr:glycosyltransferase [Candidatus Angelobacter sp.]
MSNPVSFAEGLPAVQRKPRPTIHEPFVSIIMRSFNEGWALRETLPALRAQAYKNWELIVVDSGSTDGSTDLIRQAKPAHFVQIRKEDYNPARVMNQGMQLARSEFGIFLNADATPQGSDWLGPLVKALQESDVAAVFGRQVPRPDCQAVFAHDYERCFGPNRESTQWDHFFSMVSSGLRKDVWSRRGFLEKMQYSEDDEYTRWCREQGFRIVYVPESVVMHSHNYTLQQAYKRSFGEAKALAAVWNEPPKRINFPKTVLLGWTNDARRDLIFCSQRKRLSEWPHAARIRWHQRRARLAGFREGWKFYRDGDARYGWRKPLAQNDAAVQEEIHNRGNVNSQPEISTSNAGAASPSPIGWERAGVRVPADGEENGASSRPLPRFTIDGSEELENWLARICDSVLAGVRTIVPANKLEALVLGGGYGRGQGGVLKTKSGDAPYNDLEFYVFLRGNRLLNERAYAKRLHELGDQLSPEAGLHVEFKVDSLERLRRSPVTMFSYDLLSGHRTIFGDTHLFRGCEHHLDAAQIPLAEGARLLFNRCTGLLLAKELLKKRELTGDDADFIGRNLAKAQLAIGDAILVAMGQYHWNCLERQRALSRLADTDAPAFLREAQRHHTEGVDFKLHPWQGAKTREEFLAEHEIISRLAWQVWLWLEGRRLNQTFGSARDYAINRAPKWPESPAWRNVLLNLKALGPGAIFSASAARHPRERLLNSLALLLWEEPLNDLRVKCFLQKELRTRASDWQGFATAYQAVWPKLS